MSSRTRFRTLTAAVVVAATLSAASCGIPTDDQPRALSPSTVDGSTPSTSASDVDDGEGMVRETVYLVEGAATDSPDGEKLSPIDVEVANTSDPAELVKRTIEQLVALNSDKGLTNAVPSDIEVLSATLEEDGTVLTLDLSDEFYAIQQSLQRRAFAQIVFTATGVTPLGIDRVRFLIEGAPIAASTGLDVTPTAGQAVSQDDYPAFKSSMQSTTTELGSN